MREIKFRGKDILHKKWQYGSLAKDEPQKAYYIIDNDCGRGIDVDESTIGQYTGLKDKNGKEIYEGDILRNVYYKYSNDEVGNKGFKEEILKVVYRGCGFIFEKIKINEIEMLEDFREEFIEVIGNIYENPELLKEA